MTLTDSRIEDASAKAATLIEALPWLNRFHGQTVVIKYGGHAMADEELRLAFAQDLVFLRYAGLRPVVVHGGGPQISAQLDRLGVESSFTAGPPGHHPGGHGGRPDGPVRHGEQGHRRPDQPARPVRGGPVRGGRGHVHRDPQDGGRGR